MPEPEAEVADAWSRRQEVVDKALEDRKKVGILESQVDEVNEPPCGSRGQFEVIIYTVAGGSFIVAVSLVVVILVRYVWPPHRKPPDFLPASCRITATSFERRWRECQCSASPSCLSEYPCLKIDVEMVYEDNNGTDHVIHTVLYGDLFALAKYQCSVIPSCGANRTVNNEVVRRFDLQWGVVGAAVRCHRSVRAPSRVVLRLPPGDAEARMASVQLAICLTFIALLCFTSCLFVALVYGCRDCRSFIKHHCRGKAHLPRAM